MNNGEQPINPLYSADGKFYCNDDNTSNWVVGTRPLIGLTKREIFSMSAMHGLLANHLIIDTANDHTAKWIATESIKQADELLKQLETK